MEELLEDSLTRVGRATLALTGHSMAPTLLPGDVLEVTHCAAAELSPGDIVLFRGLVVHRYLYTTARGLIARGDGSRSTDPPWSATSVLGRIHFRTRAGRRKGLRGGWARIRGRLLACYWSCRRHLRRPSRAC